MNFDIQTLYFIIYIYYYIKIQENKDKKGIKKK